MEFGNPIHLVEEKWNIDKVKFIKKKLEWRAIRKVSVDNAWELKNFSRASPEQAM